MEPTNQRDRHIARPGAGHQSPHVCDPGACPGGRLRALRRRRRESPLRAAAGAGRQRSSWGPGRAGSSCAWRRAGPRGKAEWPPPRAVAVAAEPRMLEEAGAAAPHLVPGKGMPRSRAARRPGPSVFLPPLTWLRVPAASVPASPPQSPPARVSPRGQSSPPLSAEPRPGPAGPGPEPAPCPRLPRFPASGFPVARLAPPWSASALPPPPCLLSSGWAGKASASAVLRGAFRG